MMTETLALATRPGLSHEEWLVDRRERIGASEAAAALGLSPFMSPRELYLQKLGELEDTAETEPMRWGTLLEPVIVQEYTRRTGNAVPRCQVEFRAEHGGAPLGATLDGLTEGGWPLECKAISAWSARQVGEEETDELPPHWLCQAHQQMLLAGADRVDFAVLIGGQRFEVRTVQRNDQLIERMVGRLGQFWGHVRRREPPPLCGRRDERLMHLIYPDSDGEIVLTEEHAAAVERWQAMGAEMKELEEDRKTTKAEILEAMGNAAVGRLPDGRALTRKTVNVEEQVVTRKGYTFVDLRVRKGAT